MGEFLDDGELGLPSEFLADDFFAEKDAKNSPGESVGEAESDEEDHLAGLTRRMAHSFLLDDDSDSPKAQVMAGSPQSTLCGVGSWSFSSRGSPDGPSQVSSPPETPLERPKDNAWDLLYAAAGQVVEMTLHDDSRQRGLLGAPRKPVRISPPAKVLPDGCYRSPVLTQQQLQAAQFYELKQQQLIRQQLSAAVWSRQNQTRSRATAGGNGSYGEVRSVRPLGLSSSAWPPLNKQPQQPPPPPPQQAQPGSGMRAVFLNGAGSRRESAGTGVFLPRRIGSPPETRKKPAACSTVLLPARVVQALNLNLDEMGVHPRLPGCYLDQDSFVARVNATQKRTPVHQSSPAASSPELRLPSEWTY